MTVALTMPKQEPTTYIERLLYEKEQSIDWLAREASMSYSQTWSIVRNGISSGTRIGNIEKIAKALGVTVYDILSKHERQQ